MSDGEGGHNPSTEMHDYMDKKGQATQRSSGESPLHMGILWKRTFNSPTGKGQRLNNLYGLGKKQDGKCPHKAEAFASLSRGINIFILKRGKAATGFSRLYPLSFTPDPVEVVLSMMPI